MKSANTANIGITENSHIFDDIYRSGKWRFGIGVDSIWFLDRYFLNFINHFLQSHPDIKTVVDVGCGDWRIGRRLRLDGRRYIGCDVSKFIRPGTEFLTLDAAADDLPKGDLAIVRDVLQHLCCKDVAIILSKLEKFPYVVIQNDYFRSDALNKDILNGEWRPVDITIPPFCFNNYKLVSVHTGALYKPWNAARRILGMSPIIVQKGIHIKTPMTDF